jgi:hypothetical protein
MSESTNTGSFIPSILRLLSSLGLGGEPQMDTKAAQAVAQLDANHKAFHYYGETVREYTLKAHKVEGICFYSGNKKHADNRDEVLNFLNSREISYAVKSGKIYVMSGPLMAELEDGDFILFQKSDSPLSEDTSYVMNCVAMMKSFEIPESADLHPDDFSMAEGEEHEGTGGPEFEE